MEPTIRAEQVVAHLFDKTNVELKGGASTAVISIYLWL